jgi:signal transduction histidine kinase
MRRGGYWSLLAAAYAAAILIGWTTLATQIDNDVYDFLFRVHSNRQPAATSVIYGIDEETLRQGGGQPNLRQILADGMERLAPHKPAVVVLDLILADAVDEAEDGRLAAALARFPRVVLASSLVRADVWENPLPVFPRTAVGHVHADPDPFDNVVRQIALEKAAGRDRRWALALEALRGAEPNLTLEEDPQSLAIGGARLEAPQREARPMLIRFRPPDQPISLVSLAELERRPALGEQMRGKVVFVGLTAQSAAQDRHMTPLSYGQTMVGVEIHANAYETLKQRAFFRRAGNLETALAALAFVAAIGLIFVNFSGWKAYTLAAALLLAAHAVPYLAFERGLVLPYTAPFAAAWLGAGAAAAYYYFVTRLDLAKARADREHYQRAMHFVAHEMRSPLTAIQGSSEMMGRYQLTEEKRADMARMIHSESKRLAQMIQTFLDVERLSAGEMEMKREPYALEGLVNACLERARPLAERKRIELVKEGVPEKTLSGDRELMEYALYNLINNAIKYSPAETTVRVGATAAGGNLRLFVRDEGIGMDQSELSQIFQKFYRTKRAEATGEAGTGIGLSIVDQIVVNHGGRMNVESSPGAGSCFTIILSESA